MKQFLRLVLVLGWIPLAQANLLYEGFEYGAPNSDPLADDLALNHRDGGSGWHDSLTDWELQQRAIPQKDMGYGAGLSYADLEIVGGAAQASVPTPGAGGWGWNSTANTWDAIERTYWANPAIFQQYDGFSLWVSVLLRIDSLAPTTNTDGTMPPSAQLSLTHSGMAATGIGFNGATSFLRLSSAAGNADSAVQVATGQTYLLVLQLAYRETTVDRYLWVNPAQSTLGGDDLASATASASVLGGAKPTMHGKLYLDAFSPVVFDEIRVGTTYAFVTPVIPEPASVLLLASGLVAAWQLRRRA